MTIRTVRLPSLLLVESLGGYAACAVIAQIFSRGEGAGPSVYGVAAIVIASFALGRALQQTDLGETGLRAFGLPVSAVLLFVILRTEYAAGSPPWDFAWLRRLLTDAGGLTPADGGVIAGGLTMILLFLRGVSRGQQPDDFDGALSSASIGGVCVVIAAASSPATRGGDAFGLVALAYLVAAMGVLVLYRAADPERSIRDVAARSAGGVAAVLGAAGVLTVIAAAIDPGAFGFLAPAGRPIGYAAQVLGHYIFGPPFALLAWIFDLLLPSAGNPPQPDLQTGMGPTPEEDKETPLWVRIFGYAVAATTVALVALLVLAVLWLILRRYGRRQAGGTERRDRVEGDSMLLDDVGDLLDGLARRFRRQSRAEPSAIAIRRLYGEMLDHASAAGVERPASATPSQFAPQLDAQYASDAPSAITEAFVASRYGAHHADEGAVRVLRDRWRETWDR